MIIKLFALLLLLPPFSSALDPNSTLPCPLPSLPLRVAQYYPTYTDQTPAQVQWAYADLAFFFVLETNSTGLGPADTNLAQEFVATAVSAGGNIPLFTVGSWTGSRYFSNLVATSEGRSTFGYEIANFMYTNGFYGVDIDWEYLGQQGVGNNIVSGADSANLLQFLAELRSILGPTKLITGAFSSSLFVGNTGVQLSSFSAYANYLNYITVMDYDMYGNSWSPTTGPNAALFTCNAQSDGVNASINLWINAGFPACQILLGVPAYSHIFRTAKSQIKTTTYGNSTTKAFQRLDVLSNQPGDPSYTYFQLISNGWLGQDSTVGAGGYKRSYDGCTQTPFLFNAQQRLFISYDDNEYILAKATFARSMGLAGVAVFDSSGASVGMLQAARYCIAGDQVAEMVGDAEEEGAQEWTDVCGPDQVLDEGGTCIDQPQLVFGGDERPPVVL